MATTFYMDTSGTTNATYEGRYLSLSCTQRKDIANNKSYIDWTLSAVGGNVKYYDTGPTTVTIGGKQVYYRDRVTWSSYAFPAAKGSVSGTVEMDHNGDGSKQILCTIKTAVYQGAASANTASKYWTLDDIPRAALLLSAPNFTDEENPTITFDNPAGNAVDSVQVCITDESGNILVPYRSVTRTATSYTFNLTDSERTALIGSVPSGEKTTYVRFYIKTYINGAMVGELRYLTRILTVVNTTPELNAVAKDIGSGSTVLTGNQNVMIKGSNYITASMTPTLKKGASIVRQSIINGRQTINDSSAVFQNTENNTFKFSLTDSFGNTVTETISIPIIDYVNLTCNLTSNNPTTKGDLAFKISGNYFNNSFGAVNNELNVKWRIRENNDAYGEWTTVSCTLNGNSYSVTINLSELNPNSVYTIQAIATDKINPSGVLSEEKRVKNTPVFDWGEKDFAVNGDFNLEGSLTASGTTFKVNNYIECNGVYTTGYSEILPEGEESLDYWLNLKNGWYWHNAHRPIADLPSDWGWIYRAGYIGGDFVAFYFTQAEGPVYIKSGNHGYVTGWKLFSDPGYMQLKPVTLYENSSGTNGTITLSESAANFSYLEFEYGISGGRRGGSFRIYNPNPSQMYLSVVQATNTTSTTIHRTLYRISDNTVTSNYLSTSGNVILNSSAGTVTHTCTESTIYIYRVTGVR